MATPFQNFVNDALGKEIQAAVPVGGNFTPNLFMKTTGVGMQTVPAVPSITDYANVLTVATSGAMFTTIQSAIDSILNNTNTVIQIAPGTYSESLTIPANRYICFEGLGGETLDSPAPHPYVIISYSADMPYFVRISDATHAIFKNIQFLAASVYVAQQLTADFIAFVCAAGVVISSSSTFKFYNCFFYFKNINYGNYTAVYTFTIYDVLNNARAPGIEFNNSWIYLFDDCDYGVTEHIYINASGAVDSFSFQPIFRNCAIQVYPNFHYARSQTFIFAVTRMHGDIEGTTTANDFMVNCNVQMICLLNSNDTFILVKLLDLGAQLCIRNSMISAGTQHLYPGVGFKFYVVYNNSNSSLVWLYYNYFGWINHYAGNYYWYRFPTSGTDHTCRVGWNTYTVYGTDGAKCGNLYYDDKTVRSGSVPNTGSLTVDSDVYDQYEVTALAQPILINNPSGTPVDGQRFNIRIKSAASKVISYGTKFRGSVDLPLATATSGGAKTDYLGFIWNSADGTWDYIAKNAGF